MPLRGTAFLAIWHDIETDGELEFNAWHTREHMPERLGVPGFAAGRRFVDWSLDRHRYFTLYEARTIDVLGSDAYRARLDAPSEWTRRVQPTFTNFVRGACRTVVSSGKGVGGALATIRIDFAEPKGPHAVGTASSDLAAAMLDHHGVTSVHVGIADPVVTQAPTTGSTLRQLTGEEAFDAVVLVDGIGRREVEQALPAIEAALAPVTGGAATASAVYDLAYSLTAEEI